MMRHAARRAQTTERLLDAAAEVFAHKGFHAATIDDIAGAAGYTKGAVYSNFASKDELFLALADRHLDGQLVAVERLRTLTDEELREELRSASSHEHSSGGSFGLLMLELWLYAARDARFRSALAERYRTMRERLAVMIAERRTRPSGSPAEAAALVLALDAGLFLQHLVDPDAITPDLRATAIGDVIDARHRG